MDNNYRNDRPLGYQQFVGAAAATSLTVPAGAVFAIITTETQAIRWRDDGTNPTSAIGYPLTAGSELMLTSPLGVFRFIEQAASATVNVSYYGFPL